MASPTALNDQITDSVTQSALQVVGATPALSFAELRPRPDPRPSPTAP